MKLIRGQLKLTRCLSKSVVTIGNFDGFHLGHQQLLNAVRRQGLECGAPTGVISFEPHPPEFFNPGSARPRLMRFKEKWRFLQGQSIDYLICLRFNEKLARCSAVEFVENILVQQLGSRAIVVGDDFRFGAERTGDIQLLKNLGLQYDFKVIVIPGLIWEGERISSTRARKALQNNHLNLFTELLGRPYFLYGKVIHGDARGRQWGFPTANIDLTGKTVPLSGIYVVRVLGISERPMAGVASVGARPMFANGRTILEVHLLDFKADLYGRKLTVEFLHKLRDEQVFANTAQLIHQIGVDVQDAREYFDTTLAA
jgi:riboflavin kinase / FMN adenylyltransferase